MGDASEGFVGTSAPTAAPVTPGIVDDPPSTAMLVLSVGFFSLIFALIAGLSLYKRRQEIREANGHRQGVAMEVVMDLPEAQYMNLVLAMPAKSIDPEAPPPPTAEVATPPEEALPVFYELRYANSHQALHLLGDEPETEIVTLTEADVGLPV